MCLPIQMMLAIFLKNMKIGMMLWRPPVQNMAYQYRHSLRSSVRKVHFVIKRARLKLIFYLFPPDVSVLLMVMHRPWMEHGRITKKQRATGVLIAMIWMMHLTLLVGTQEKQRGFIILVCGMFAHIILPIMLGMQDMVVGSGKTTHG